MGAEMNELAASLESMFDDSGMVQNAPPPPPADAKPAAKAKVPTTSENAAPLPTSSSDADDDDEEEGDEEVEAQADDDSEPAEETDEGEEKPRKPATLAELAEALEVDPSELMSLKLKTKVDGVEGEATLAEVLKNYQLGEHVNRKSMAIAEEKRALEQQVAQARQTLSSQVDQLTQAQELLKAMLWGEYGNIDWTRLVEDDPDDYQRKYLGYQQRYGQLKLIQDTLAQHQTAAQQAARQQYEAYLQEQRQELANRMPTWNDQKAQTQAMTELDDYLQSYGLNQGTIHTLDHWSGPVIAWKAMQYDKLQKETEAVKEKVKESPRFIKPGAARKSAPPDKAREKQLRQKLRSPQGSTGALAAWLMDTKQV